MNPLLSVSYAVIASFLESAEGNYRNAVYVTCSCAHNREHGCGDFLFIPGHDCTPLIVPVEDAKLFFSSGIDKTECACTIDSHTFNRLYQKWLSLEVSDSGECAVRQFLRQKGLKKYQNMVEYSQNI